MGGSYRAKGRTSFAANRYGGPSSFGSRTLNDYPSSRGTNTESKPRVFISFHVEDENQVDLLRHQAKDPRFNMEFTDYSVKEPFDEKWKTNCTERIKQSSVFIVAIGKETYQREAVNWEIEKAYELGKPVIGVRIYRDVNHKIPEAMVKHNAKIMDWSTEEIQHQLDKNRQRNN